MGRKKHKLYFDFDAVHKILCKRSQPTCIINSDKKVLWHSEEFGNLFGFSDQAENDIVTGSFLSVDADREITELINRKSVSDIGWTAEFVNLNVGDYILCVCPLINQYEELFLVLSLTKDTSSPGVDFKQVSDESDWCLLLDETGTIIESNQNSSRFCGIGYESFKSENILLSDLIEPSHKSRFINAFKQVKSIGIPTEIVSVVSKNEDAYVHAQLVLSKVTTNGDTLIKGRFRNPEFPLANSSMNDEYQSLQNHLLSIAPEFSNVYASAMDYIMVFESIREVLKASFVCVFKRDHTDRFVFEYTSKSEIINQDSNRSKFEYIVTSIVGNGSSFKESVIIPDTDYATSAEVKQFKGLSVQSVCLVPMIHNDKILGIFVVAYKEAQVYPNHRVYYIQSLAAFIHHHLIQKEIRERLRRSNNTFLNIFENSSDAVFIVELTGRIREVNKTAENLTGYTREELREMNVNEISKTESPDISQIPFEMLQSQQMIFGTEITPRVGANIPVETRERIIRYEGDLSVLVLARDVRHRREINRLMVRTISETQDQERQRIAEGLHDNVGPLLSTLKIYIDLLKNNAIGVDEVTKHSNEMVEIIDQAISETRKVARNLMPNILSDFGLVEAVNEFCKKIDQTGAVKIDFEYDKKDYNLDDAIATMIYSVVKELINNTLKHSNASLISLFFKGVDNESFEVQYMDNGHGFDIETYLERSNVGLGVRNLLSKVNSVGGDVHVLDNDGFGVRIVLPANI